MMTPSNRFSLLVLILLLSGCGTTPPSKFFMLEASATPATAGKHGEIHIGVGPVDFAEYLDRSQIVTRTDNVEVSLAETHRWAEPLADNFSRVLAQNLSVLLATDQVTLYPSRNWSTIDYQVLVNVWQFDADGNGNVTLVASWSVRGKGGAKLLMEKKSTLSTSVAATASYNEIVRGLSNTVALFSREIAAAIAYEGSQ